MLPSVWQKKNRVPLFCLQQLPFSLCTRQYQLFFLWAVSVPLGALAGLVWDWPPFWVFFCLKSEHLLKTILCLFRLKSGNWIKKIKAV